jgi:2,3-diaminopropionate biosynthesis protein SbnB
MDNRVLILTGDQVALLLDGEEHKILEAVRKSYEAHARGATSLPHSVFLTFPDEPKNRIIALPAYLGNEFNVAGVKWVSSFPENIQKGADRASAVVILNSLLTGRPEVILEGSLISAKRTAASAALAARCLLKPANSIDVGIIGSGLINFETVRFLSVACPQIKSIRIYDIDSDQAKRFQQKCEKILPRTELRLAAQMVDALAGKQLVSIATTASRPHIDDLSMCMAGATILHISLRDLSPEVILSSDNVVDDIDHVCRAQTSMHLTEQLTGNRDFIRCTLGEILLDKASSREREDKIVVFSPFGLGILDLAIAAMARDAGIQGGKGLFIESFIPDLWTERR